jgi:hypothetical protein
MPFQSNGEYTKNAWNGRSWFKKICVIANRSTFVPAMEPARRSVSSWLIRGPPVATIIFFFPNCSIFDDLANKGQVQPLASFAMGGKNAYSHSNVTIGLKKTLNGRRIYIRCWLAECLLMLCILYSLFKEKQKLCKSLAFSERVFCFLQKELLRL